jgi:hypothetical protein
MSECITHKFPMSQSFWERTLQLLSCSVTDNPTRGFLLVNSLKASERLATDTVCVLHTAGPGAECQQCRYLELGTICTHTSHLRPVNSRHCLSATHLAMASRPSLPHPGILLRCFNDGSIPGSKYRSWTVPGTAVQTLDVITSSHSPREFAANHTRTSRTLASTCLSTILDQRCPLPLRRWKVRCGVSSTCLGPRRVFQEQGV